MERFAIETREDSFSKELKKILENECLKIGMKYDKSDPQLIICIGGDGTILRAIHKYMKIIMQVYFVGIHTGTLGFLTDYTKDELSEFISDLKNGPVTVDESTLLEILIPEENRTVYALNEIRIEAYNRTISFDVYIDHEFFENCRGSGICISTQAGSTAMNRALQGAVIDPGLSVLQLTEIMPVTHKGHHSLRNPYIMNIDREVTICGKDLNEARVCYDHLELPLKGIRQLQIRAATKKVRFIRYRPFSYLTRLKSLY